MSVISFNDIDIHNTKPTPKYVYCFDGEGHVVINSITFEPDVFLMDVDFDEIKEWLDENISKDAWWLKRDIVPGSGNPNPESTTLYLSICFFEDDEEAMAFKLRWT